MTTDEQVQRNNSEVGDIGSGTVPSPGAPVRSPGAPVRSDVRARVRYYEPSFMDEPDASSSPFDVTTMMELSLFLMLLTFFLVFTANTTYDDQRVGPVIGGIQAAFGTLSGGRLDDDNGRNGAALSVMQRGAQPATGAYAAQIETAFLMAGAKAPEISGVSLNVALDIDQLFVAGSAALKANQRSLFAQVGPVLRISDPSRHVAVLVPSAPEQRLDVRRAATVARLLLEDGAPASHIAVGVRETGGETVTFRFYTLPGVDQ